MEKRSLGFLDRTDHILREGFQNEQSRLYGSVNKFIILVILISITLIVLETVEAIHVPHALFFRVVDVVVLAIFILEYLANLHVTRPRRKYVLSMWGLIDLVAILPSLLTLMPQLRIARILRVLRFLRILRVLKLTKTVARALDESSKRSKYGTLILDLQIYALAMLTVLVISSTLAYYAESAAQPDKFKSIPDAMWWAIITMTTVGYGDYYPVTLAGRLVGGATALCGLALFALLMNVMGKAMLKGLFGSESDTAEEADSGASAELFTVPGQINQLAGLRDSGILTEDEFQSKKAELLARM